MQKLKLIYEQNILIPKNRSEPETSSADQPSALDESTLLTVAQDQFMTNLQAEIRKMHRRLQQRDEQIKSLRESKDGKAKFQVNKPLVNEMEDDAYEREVIQFLTNVDENVEFEFKESCFLTPDVLSKIYASQVENLRKALAAI